MMCTQKCIQVYLVLLLFWMSRVFTQQTEAVECNYHQYIGIGDTNTYYIFNPGYPYTSSNNVTWCILKPKNLTIPFICDKIDIPASRNCDKAALTISSVKGGTRSYCGSRPFQQNLTFNEAVINFHSSTSSAGGKFLCYIKLNQAETTSEMCDCGTHNTETIKIVGGKETGVNEFPYMAGLVNGSHIVCGATIISPRYVLTAAHCLSSLPIDHTTVLVGDHNIATGSDTNAAQLFKVSKYIPHPEYNKKAGKYDIALIMLKSEIKYSSRVQPVCLPFVSGKRNLTGETVTVLGWGRTSKGGEFSKYLKKTSLRLLSSRECGYYVRDISYLETQICAVGVNTDSCQGDSGGPLLFFNPVSKRYDLVGLVSSGFGCDGFSFNTNVSSFLPWIMENTPGETYCKKG